MKTKEILIVTISTVILFVISPAIVCSYFTDKRRLACVKSGQATALECKELFR